MPNHCDQTVTFKGPTSLIIKLHAAVEASQLLQAVRPMPFQEDNWYEWCNTNWNTKWDICDPRVTDQSWDKETPYWLLQDKTDELEFTFTCWTAWAPPTPIWEDIWQTGVSVVAEYIDEGGFFQGTFINGKTSEWVPQEEACH